MQKLVIEWKHLEMEGETCDRCYDTGENLVQEIKRLNRKFNPMGYEVVLKETVLGEDRVNESNAISLNGVALEDIVDISVADNYCESCSDLVGSETYCRTVVYDGSEYEDVPAKAIREAVYKALGLKMPKAGKTSSCDCGQKGCC